MVTLGSNFTIIICIIFATGHGRKSTKTSHPVVVLVNRYPHTSPEGEDEFRLDTLLEGQSDSDKDREAKGHSKGRI